MKLTMLAAALGFLAVAFGAFGAHALGGRLTAEGTGWWQTATLYLLTHAGVAAAIGMTGFAPRAGWCMALGAALFAATLYAMALGAPRWFGAITPLGGVGMLAGWALLFVSAVGRT